ncbi:proline--tRNA ligase [Thiobacillus denitrificans]|uniref:Proline--tRNA ligase n=1 Tax=Thiobacillus denitrificans (strain ATCC 25259 / T1) TaxID=292415 RepID=SYP_THIDA|nr:proline--tRNA ligase [Thiobacillus denitrificans]Q3SH24.2 RecName: Full=Proline--tRNA ligase; AltName: Full=Prolyl-tRNA synthetase; Short=ProRS [Thiobacillus denitrificans ATCC 25259]
MRTTQFFLSTTKEAPSEAELVSHKLMLRAGLIKRLGSGLYTWMPLGLRVLRRVEAVVREEMNRAGAIELLMPAVQPAELWQETGRWAQFGPQMLKIKDRHEREFCFGPTHEEVITDLARREIKSYRQLPLNFYQIQTKFRDEIRPRFGVMRAREFLMKDAYSFHASRESLAATYQAMYDAYGRIFTRLGLRFRAVAADTGAIGGSASHEFHVLADSGEDLIAYCPDSDYAANVELAEALAPAAARGAPQEAMREVETPKQTTCEDVAALLGIPLARTVKLIAVMAGERMVVVLLRGDHMLNEVKLAKIEGLADFRLANEAEIRAVFDCPPGFLGPVGIDRSTIRVIADRAVAVMSDFVCGANKPKFHLAGVNFGRDLQEPDLVADIRNVVAGDPSPDGKGTLALCRGIEVGHVFQLGNKYSQAMNATYLDEAGKAQAMEMGCYGIGVSRIVAAAVEQNHDGKGIVWPASMAPFSVVIVAIGYGKSASVKNAADTLYADLMAVGVEVLLDDRDERPGVMFADAELVGIPHRVTLGERGLNEGVVEYQPRRAAPEQGADARKIAVAEAKAFLMGVLGD